MATRISRKSVTTTTERASTSGETPKAGVSPGRRGRSPSPARLLRTQEKEQLQSLNDRLAAYIDKVRYLESENNRLQIQVRTSEETVTRETTNIKALYEAELQEARQLLDETAKEKAKLTLDANKFKTEAGEWQTKYLRRDRDAQLAEKKLLEQQALVGELKNQLNDSDNARKYAEGEAARLRGQVRDLEKQLAEAKKQLEDETIKRVDLENRIQSLKEELDFKNKIHEQEMTEIKTKKVTEYDELDSGVRAEYETKFQDALMEARQVQEEQLRQVREEVEELYERKVIELQGALDRSMNAGHSSREEYVLTKRRVDDLNSEINKLKAQNAGYESRIEELEDQIRHENSLYEEQLLQKDKELMDLRDALADQTREYADLLDIKLRLDAELEAYNKMLLGEEERLSKSFEHLSPKKGRGTKRKRVTIDESLYKSGFDYSTEAQSKGPIEIHDTDHHGKFIKLFNTGDEDVVMGGWVLKHVAGEEETTYKFTKRLTLKAGQFLTVWSSNAGATHSPPSDLVLKNQQWNTGDEMKSSLYQDDEEMATRELKKNTDITLRSLRTSQGGSSLDKRGESCSIM